MALFELFYQTYERISSRLRQVYIFVILQVNYDTNKKRLINLLKQLLSAQSRRKRYDDK